MFLCAVIPLTLAFSQCRAGLVINHHSISVYLYIDCIQQHLGLIHTSTPHAKTCWCCSIAVSMLPLRIMAKQLHQVEFAQVIGFHTSCSSSLHASPAGNCVCMSLLHVVGASCKCTSDRHPDLYTRAFISRPPVLFSIKHDQVHKLCNSIEFQRYYNVVSRLVASRSYYCKQL